MIWLRTNAPIATPMTPNTGSTTKPAAVIVQNVAPKLTSPPRKRINAALNGTETMRVNVVTTPPTSARVTHLATRMRIRRGSARCVEVTVP